MKFDYDAEQAAHTRAFSEVEPKTHWKDRIDADMTLTCAHYAGGIEAITAAIIHFTATVPKVTINGDRVRFEADGYWGGPAA